VARYDPAVHGPGELGIRLWKTTALAWLDGHPGRALPVGEHGTVMDVLQEAVRLLHVEWGFCPPEAGNGG
jgi:hypothetical protein